MSAKEKDGEERQLNPVGEKSSPKYEYQKPEYGFGSVGGENKATKTKASGENNSLSLLLEGSDFI